MRFGVALRVRYEAMRDVTVAAEELGYESVWLPEHLVWPADLGGTSPYADGHPPVDPTIPTLDTLMVLLALGTATTRIRLGAYVYNLALRHPIVAARAVQTLDVLTAGRVELGVGAGWLPGEWAAVGLDFATRGRRLDECIDVVRALWTDELPEHHGEFVSFGPVHFEPKPVQGTVPVHVGGESAAALRRAARKGDGWIGMAHTPESAAGAVSRLRDECERAGRDPATLVVTVGGDAPDGGAVEAFAAAGVDRLIVAPWARTADAVTGLQRHADEVVRAYGEAGR